MVKANGSFRICGDYKTTVNAASKLVKYPLPRIDDLFSQLEGGKMFSKLDLSSAFQQIPLNEESRKFTTINTNKGLFQYTCLPFGILSTTYRFSKGSWTVSWVDYMESHPTLMTSLQARHPVSSADTLQTVAVLHETCIFYSRNSRNDCFG